MPCIICSHFYKRKLLLKLPCHQSNPLEAICLFTHVGFIMCNCDLLLFVFSVEVILRAEAVETAQAGDQCDFTGTLVVVPDVSSIASPGMVGHWNTIRLFNEMYMF